MNGAKQKKRLNSGELQLALFCKGVRIGAGCDLERDARGFSRTRAGLGSGLELKIPGRLKDLWLNAPVHEPFVTGTPFTLIKKDGRYVVEDEETKQTYPATVPPEPAWYSKKTSSGVEMSRIGVLQGTYLGIYIGPNCGYWTEKEKGRENCQFCTTGLNLGANESLEKSVDDVVETALAAKEESGVTFVHFNSGFQGGRGLNIAAPYVAAIKERVGALVGVQLAPAKELWKYDWLIDLGADHFSFCYEFHNIDFFRKYLPGKNRTLGQGTFFRALEYTSKKMGRGRVSGEIIAGIEPVEDTLKAIDYITRAGAFPTVCIFRPLEGSDMAGFPSPTYEDMRPVFQAVFESCRKRLVPIGVTPNIEVSLILQPADAVYLAPATLANRGYFHLMGLAGKAMSGSFKKKMSPHPVIEAAMKKWPEAQFESPRNPIPQKPATV